MHTLPWMGRRDWRVEMEGVMGSIGQYIVFVFVFLNLKTAFVNLFPLGLLPTHKSNSDSTMKSNYFREMS